jgi:DNA-directed RNA polymerase subunit RPC12/RpoP
MGTFGLRCWGTVRRSDVTMEPKVDQKVPRKECRMAGCHVFGIPNFTCSRCDKRIVYFCSDCQKRIVSELKILGKMDVVCASCVLVKST